MPDEKKGEKQEHGELKTQASLGSADSWQSWDVKCQLKMHIHGDFVLCFQDFSIHQA